MSKTEFIVVNGKPHGKGRPRFWNGHAVTDATTRSREKLIADAWKENGCEKFEGACEVNIIACYPIPKATTKKNRKLMEEDVLLPTVKPDLDNVVKEMLDGSKDIFKDDAYVVKINAEKVYAEDPCVYMCVTDGVKISLWERINALMSKRMGKIKELFCGDYNEREEEQEDD